MPNHAQINKRCYNRQPVRRKGRVTTPLHNKAPAGAKIKSYCRWPHDDTSNSKRSKNRKHKQTEHTSMHWFLGLSQDPRTRKAIY